MLNECRNEILFNYPELSVVKTAYIFTYFKRPGHSNFKEPELCKKII